MTETCITSYLMKTCGRSEHISRQTMPEHHLWISVARSKSKILPTFSSRSWKRINFDVNGPGDAVSELDPDRTPIRYYESQKVLSKLHRAIDETKFLDDLRHVSGAVNVPNRGQKAPMQSVWDFVKRQTMMIQWDHHKPFAKQVLEW